MCDTVESNKITEMWKQPQSWHEEYDYEDMKKQYNQQKLDNKHKLQKLEELKMQLKRNQQMNEIFIGTLNSI